VVVVPEAVGEEERAALVDHGATVVVVRGDYDAANRVAAEGSEDLAHWGWVNGNLRPWYSAGARSVGEELAGDRPAQVVLPMASGALAFQVHRALPSARLVVGQPAGCAPVARAWADGAEVAPVRAATRVEVLAMGDPPDGPDVLDAARRTDGAVLAVDEHELDAVVDLVAGTTGIAVDLASAVAVAAARRAVADGHLDPAARTTVVLTGGPARWPDTPVGRPGAAVTIDPSSAALREAVGEEQQP
jgi:threonine synthase